MHQIIRTPHQFGQLLQGRRKALGLSQTALGARAGVSQKRMSALELGPERITLERLLLLLSALGLELVVQEKAASSTETAQDW
jgi:HTH-type transcriptional regulator / antitoxin HipB